MPCNYTYDYFEHPEEDSTWSEHPHECGCCGAKAPGFSGPFEGEDIIDFICEECLWDGQLAEAGAVTNAVDLEALQKAVSESEPALDAEQLAELVDERFSTVAERTPPIAEAPDGFTWPIHCGDLCRFDGTDENQVLLFECTECGAELKGAQQG
jgi:uncharacterized protein CbrC (UPF0167 family)